MKISKQQLIEMNACQDGLDRFIEQTNNTDEPIEVLSLIGGKNTNSDLIWLAGETLQKEKIIRFACDVALINIEQIKPYTSQYDLIVEFLINPINARAADTATAIAIHAGDAAIIAHTVAIAIRFADALDVAISARTVAIFAHTTQEQINELLVKLFE